MKKFFLVFLVVFLIFSCNNEEKHEIKNWNKIEKKLIDINKYLLMEDKERIESYILRKEWNMQETKTGLWFEIIEEGNGDNVVEDQLVTIKYQIELLDGTICYSSDSIGEKSFKVGYSTVEKGLNEGIQLMNEGAKARFILPPHLAHGLVGDRNKIPPRSIIVYYVELTSVF